MYLCICLCWILLVQFSVLANINVNSSNSTSGMGLGYIQCQRCMCQLETYNEESMGTMILICSTLVHRDSHMAAPFILDMLMAGARIAAKKSYSWQTSLTSKRLFGYYINKIGILHTCDIAELTNCSDKSIQNRYDA